MKTFQLILCFVTMNLACCAQVFTDYDTNTDWKKYRTFAWLAPGDSVLNRYRGDKLYGGLIVYAANEQLTAKGMRPDSIGPDAIFVFHTSVKQEVEYSQSPTLSVGVAVAGPGYYAGGMAPVAGGKITAHRIEDGEIVYEMYDAETGDLLWKGGDRKNFTMSDDIEGIIRTATKKIFKKFPVKIRS
jgi:hypothetical protein